MPIGGAVQYRPLVGFMAFPLFAQYHCSTLIQQPVRKPSCLRSCAIEHHSCFRPCTASCTARGQPAAALYGGEMAAQHPKLVCTSQVDAASGAVAAPPPRQQACLSSLGHKFAPDTSIAPFWLLCAGDKAVLGSAGSTAAWQAHTCVLRLRLSHRRVWPLRALPARLLPHMRRQHGAVPHVSRGRAGARCCTVDAR